MEQTSDTELMEIDECRCLTPIAALPKDDPPQVLPLSKKIDKAKATLEGRYIDYILKSGKGLNEGCYCTALIPYVENKHLTAIRQLAEQESAAQGEMMAIDAECVPPPTPKQSLKRRRCDFCRFLAPKLMKLQCY